MAAQCFHLICFLRLSIVLWGPLLTCRVDFSDIPAEGQKVLTLEETGGADLAESLAAIHSVERAWGKNVEKIRCRLCVRSFAQSVLTCCPCEQTEKDT